MAQRILILATCVLLAFAVLAAAPAQASVTLPIPNTFTGTSGSLSASAQFSVPAAGTLQVVLTNTSNFDVLVPTQVLTAVFFSIDPGTVTLTPVSASLNGSTVFFGPDGGGNVGGEWAFASGLSGAPGNAPFGISSTGVGLFGAGNFNGSDLQGPNSVNGLQYGLTSAGDDLATGNAPVTGGYALIQNSVVFTLSYTGSLNGIFALNDTSPYAGVSFLYGTDLADPSFSGYGTPPVPEPTTFIIWSLLGSLAIMAGWRRRKAA